MRTTLLGLSAVMLLAFAGPARAAPAGSGATMDGDLSLWGLAGYGYYGDDAGFGLGGRYQAVVAPRGLLHSASVKDEIGLEFGIDWVHYAWHYYGYGWTYNEVSPVIGATWNFWLNNQLALYPKVDLAFRFGSWSSNAYPYGHPGGYGGAAIEGAVGLVFRVAPRVALRVEAGTYAFRFGVAFKI
jgi:hypothetical protein